MSIYLNREVFAMAGGSEAHNLIAGNVHGELRTCLSASSTCSTSIPRFKCTLLPSNSAANPAS